MAVGSFYKVNTYATMLGSSCQNEFWYRQSAGSGSSVELANAFIDLVLDIIRVVQSSQILYQLIKVYSHNSNSDFTEQDLVGQNGLASINSLPPFCAAGFSTPRKLSDMKSGQKRFVGVPDSVDDQGVITNAQYLLNLDSVADALSDSLGDVGTASVWDPIIVRRIKVTVNGKTYYKVPDVITNADFYAADGWSKKINVTSQNSRKYGVGV